MKSIAHRTGTSAEARGILRGPLPVTAILAATLLAPLPLQAQHGITYSPQEVAMLPRYCHSVEAYRDRVPGGREAYTYWRDRIGNDVFIHMHHYCWALTLLNNATYLPLGDFERKRQLNAAVGDFTYQIDRTPRNHVLLPEFLNNRAQANIRLGQAARAIPDLQRAIELRPDYWPSYVKLSDHFKSIGDLKNARQVIEAGLSAAPDSRTLKQRLAELNGEPKGGKTAAQPSAKPAAKTAPAKAAAGQERDPSALVPSPPDSPADKQAPGTQ